ncbi:d3cc7e56-6fcf-4225-8a6f-3f8da8d24c65 [Thermothielavioides terrestris]|uniref:F-box domain-containing protein n=2 Tax=Thermothielavioides terrestris TaxID=2587410 RepID=G2QYV4_THETT|nr:uncharacterized protein THITE_2088572 [Thermothielavioides terrestris NRRL 8126]AEO67093.1 hypothetical protein THITE_2088572 [Thermothielavioides terrestris NRRL 8126]SPQ23796.1 d3cc7e56-6fcf-4225-8a6f-3f8da8d24c65 [Thermothielavioides terrestris]
MPLEDLPTELIVRVLSSASSLADLKALAGASRRLYAVFQREKAALIYQALAAELGPVLADALGLGPILAFDASSDAANLAPLREAVARYGEYLEGTSHTPPPRRASLDDVLGLVCWYRFVADMADTYVAYTLRIAERAVRLVAAPEPSRAVQLAAAPPSRAERLRALRAFYRRLMLEHVWHVRNNWVRRPLLAPRIVKLDQIIRRLITLWAPWELQQVVCAYLYTGGQRSAVLHPLVWLDTISRDSEEEVARFRNRLRLESLSAVDEGPYALRRVPAQLRFDGDHVATVPFAWVDAFDGEYLYDFFAYRNMIQRRGKRAESLWCLFGFVMWDAPRVAALKETPLLSVCETGWARWPY